MTETALYSELADCYDILCSDIDYEEQSQAAHRLMSLLGNGGKDYLDLACGTGPHIEYFLKHNFAASGIDINHAMLEQAKLRCPNAQFFCQDMTSFSLSQKFDLITCFLYSIHYCYPLDSLKGTFSSAFSALKPGGIFIFDAVDKNKIANDEGVKHSNVVGPHTFSFQTRWHYSGCGDLLDLHLFIEKLSGGKRQIWNDHHQMIAIDILSVREKLVEAGFEVTILERDFTSIKLWDGESGNVIFVASKPYDLSS